MPYRQRDLLLVPVPFSNLSRRKLRPVVVLSNGAYNRSGPDLLIAGITSNLSERPYTVALDTAQLERGSMRRLSMVRADKVFSIDHGVVMAQFGRVNEQTFERICQQVHALLGKAS